MAGSSQDMALSPWLPVLGGLHSVSVREGQEGDKWDGGAVFAFCITLGSSGTGNREPHYSYHMHTPLPLIDSPDPLPRPYLPTAKTVSPMVRFCCIASCWATSGSKVPSQTMGAPQEVQVRTSGRALARAGVGDGVHLSTHLVMLTAISPCWALGTPRWGIPSPWPRTNTNGRSRDVQPAGPLGGEPGSARVGGRRAGTLGHILQGTMGNLRGGGTVSPYQRCRRPVKLSLSRGILAKGQVPMGMKVSRCLLGGGSHEGHASRLSSPAPYGEGEPRTLEWAGMVTPASPQGMLGKTHVNPVPEGPPGALGRGGCT